MMGTEFGRSGADAPSGHSRAEPEEVSALRASVPNAAYVPYSVRAKVMRAISDPGSITMRILTEAGMVEVLLHWQARAVLDVVLELAATSPAFASAIEARRAETQGGSVADESAVANGETPTPSSAQPGDA